MLGIIQGHSRYWATYINDCVDILESDIGQKDKKSPVYVHDVFDCSFLALENQCNQAGNELQSKHKAIIKFLSTLTIFYQTDSLENLIWINKTQIKQFLKLVSVFAPVGTNTITSYFDFINKEYCLWIYNSREDFDTDDCSLASDRHPWAPQNGTELGEPWCFVGRTFEGDSWILGFSIRLLGRWTVFYGHFGYIFTRIRPFECIADSLCLLLCVLFMAGPNGQVVNEEICRIEIRRAFQTLKILNKNFSISILATITAYCYYVLKAKTYHESSFWYPYLSL